MILRGVSFFDAKYEYLGENKTKSETVLTHWSVAQAGSNDEKNWGSKISLGCPSNYGMKPDSKLSCGIVSWIAWIRIRN